MKRLIQKRDVRIGLPLLFLMSNLLQDREQIDEMVRAFQKPLVVHAEQVYLADRILENQDGLFDWLRGLNEDGLLLVEDAELRIFLDCRGIFASPFRRWLNDYE